MKVREATASDFDKIYILLKRLNDITFNEDAWRAITSVNFKADLNHYGYVLESESEILGFLGTIFSEREFNGIKLKFCNIHSWIVDPKAKTGGMILLLKVLSLKDCVVTNFTASEEPYKIFKHLKFNEIDYKNFKLFPLQSFRMSLKTVVEKINDQNADRYLDYNELRLYNDHKQFENVQFLYIGNDEESSFVISKRKKYTPVILKKMPFLFRILEDKFKLSEIHYVSNQHLFCSAFSNTAVAIRICGNLRSIGIIVANRFIPNHFALKKKHYPSKRPYFYKHINEDQIVDTLYSEFFVLNF